MSPTWDVVVVGAGPAGSASAAMFAAQGRHVLLLDAMRFPRSKACAEYISPGGVAVLERLGVLRALGHDRAGRWLRGMEIQAPGGARHLVDYHAAGTGQLQGLSISRVHLDATLVDCARATGAEVREGFRVRDVWYQEGRVRGIVGTAGERIAADL